LAYDFSQIIQLSVFIIQKDDNKTFFMGLLESVDGEKTLIKILGRSLLYASIETNNEMPLYN
jgi:hypothetical protein